MRRPLAPPQARHRRHKHHPLTSWLVDAVRLGANVLLDAGGEVGTPAPSFSRLPGGQHLCPPPRVAREGHGRSSSATLMLAEASELKASCHVQMKCPLPSLPAAAGEAGASSSSMAKAYSARHAVLFSRFIVVTIHKRPESSNIPCGICYSLSNRRVYARSLSVETDSKKSERASRVFSFSLGSSPPAPRRPCTPLAPMHLYPRRVPVPVSKARVSLCLCRVFPPTLGT
mmetsp:Transcript_38793/g.90443  ORF Transcript_38793/g.90443 Transcript_38793/m.90443 type:complete len:229 (-) Transcript_38793:11-697(-)